MHDFFRYFIAAGVAYLIFYVLFRKRWQHRKIQDKEFKRSQFWHEFKYSLSTVIIFSLIGLIIFAIKNHGYTLIYDSLDAKGLYWLPVSFILMVLLHDAYFYWTHRLMHHPKLFKTIHLVHHRSTSPSPWAAYSFHPLEAIIEAGIFPVIVFIIPSHGLVLFAFTTYMIIRNVFGHLGIEILPKWFVGSRMFGWHTTSVHHDLHHAYFNNNYGLYFCWWDRWFKTEHPDYRKLYQKVTDKKRILNNKNCKLRLLLVFLFSLQSLFAQSVTGSWETYDDETGLPLSQIRISKKGNSIEGILTKIFLLPWQGEDPLCSKCKGAKKDRPVLGMNILEGVVDHRANPSKNEWEGGSILDPASGELYNCNIKLIDSETIVIKGRAGLFGVISFSLTWKKTHPGDSWHPLTGVWQVLDINSHKPKSLVKVTVEDSHIKAVVEKIYLQPWEGEDPICIACKDELKGVKVVGMRILSQFKNISETKWEEGKILDPGNGKVYTSSIWLKDENTLMVRGYWGVFYRTQQWKRIRE